jgi:hypothetical protein
MKRYSAINFCCSGNGWPMLRYRCSLGELLAPIASALTSPELGLWLRQKEFKKLPLSCRACGWGRFILVSQFLLRLLPKLVFLAFWPAMALPDLISALLDFFFGVTRCAVIPVRGSRQFRPNLSEPKPRRSIRVVGYRPRVSAALLSLPAIPFCICRCHALSCAAGRSVPGDERDAHDIASRTRSIAGCWRFLTLTQSGERPLR